MQAHTFKPHVSLLPYNSVAAVATVASPRESTTAKLQINVLIQPTT